MLSRYWRLLRHNRNYRLLWIAQVVSELGDWFYTLAVYDLLLQNIHPSRRTYRCCPCLCTCSFRYRSR